MKSGSGALTLDQPHTFTGLTTIGGGTLTMSGSGSFSDSTAVTVDSGATYVLGADDEVGSIAGAGSINLASFVLTSGLSLIHI